MSAIGEWTRVYAFHCMFMQCDYAIGARRVVIRLQWQDRSEDKDL